MRVTGHAVSAFMAVWGVVCLTGVGGGAWAADAKALPAINLGNANAAAGQVAAVPISYAPAGATVEPSTLVLKATWDASWITFSSVSAGPVLAGSGKAFDFEVHGKTVTVVISGGRDLITPPAVADRIVGLLPAPTWVRLPTAAHSMLDTRQDAALRIISEVAGGRAGALSSLGEALDGLPAVAASL